MLAWLSTFFSGGPLTDGMAILVLVWLAVGAAVGVGILLGRVVLEAVHATYAQIYDARFELEMPTAPTFNAMILARLRAASASEVNEGAVRKAQELTEESQVTEQEAVVIGGILARWVEESYRKEPERAGRRKLIDELELLLEGRSVVDRMKETKA